jgi:hypothetical protein
MRKSTYLSESRRINSTSTFLTVIALYLVIVVGPLSEAHGEDVQGTLVRRTAGRDFGLPYTELKICPAVQPGGKCISIFTGPSGRFSVNLNPGRYSVTVTYQAKQTYAGQIDVVGGRGNYPRIVIAQ